MRAILAGVLFTLAGAAVAADEAPAAVEQPRSALPAAKATHARLLGLAPAGGKLIAVGQQGLILQSSDGEHWQQMPSPVSSMLNRARFLDEHSGWIVGYDGAILGTHDGGQSWKLLHYDATGRALHDVLFLDAQHGIAVGAYGTVMLTADGGATWAAQASALSDLSLHLNVILKLRDGALLIAGEKGLLARSTDAGQNWQLLKSPYVGSWFGALPQGDKGVLVYGMRGNVYGNNDLTHAAPETAASFDAPDREVPGHTSVLPPGWKAYPNEVHESLLGGTLLDAGHALLVGVNGVMTEADLSAGTLHPLKRLNDEPLADVALLGQQRVVVGRRGVRKLGVQP